MNVWVFIVLFFVILLGIIVINYKLNNEFKIDTSWLALALTPMLIWLLTTQQLSEFSGFGLGFKFRQATATPVSLKVDGDAITPEQISSDSKQGEEKINQLKANRTAALTLELGKQGYYVNSIIKKYLLELTPLSFFKYVLFINQEGNFQAMIPANRLLEEMQNTDLNLKQAIENNNIENIEGMITMTVRIGSSKQTALQLMDSHDLSQLPVVNESNRFVGVVEREKITSNIVAKIASSLAN